MLPLYRHVDAAEISRVRQQVFQEIVAPHVERYGPVANSGRSPFIWPADIDQQDVIGVLGQPL